MSARLVLGPMLRYVDAAEATIWVETDAPCEAEALGHTASTFTVSDHHYALIVISGLEPGRTYSYEVRLDGELVWPPFGSALPPSEIHTLDPAKALQVAFGSCRVAVPQGPPYSLTKREDPRGRGPDALAALAHRMLADPTHRPELLLLLGDQVYADDVPPATEAFIRSRRHVDGEHGLEASDFEEYAQLYREAWDPEIIRWALATVASATIFDDHDVHDDWNASKAWRDQITSESWWDERIIAAFVSYWVYQHLGNMSPEAIRASELYARVQEADDAMPILREAARLADREPAGAQWSYHRELGSSRLVVIDSRASRVLEPGHRDMLDEREWEWLEQHVTGGVDHLLIATSLPFLLGGAMHPLEAWNEAVCDGAWGKRAARFGERVRQALDLEHWAAFDTSFRRLAGLMESVVAGERGAAPESLILLSGDVHHAYLAKASFPPGSRASQPIYQAVCSPLRNPLAPREQRAIRMALSRPMAAAGRMLARSAGVKPLPLTWEVTDGPWFENQVATVDLDGKVNCLRIEAAGNSPAGEPELKPVLERRLSG